MTCTQIVKLKDFVVTRNGQEIEGTNPPTFSLDFGTIVQTKGSYDGVKGQLSNAIVLQDSKFYQKYSYEITTTNTIEQWIAPLKRTTHPAGTEVFSLFRMFDEIPAGTDFEVFAESVTPPIYLLGDNQSIQETLVSFGQDYASNEIPFFADDYTGFIIFEESEDSFSIIMLPTEIIGV